MKKILLLSLLMVIAFSMFNCKGAEVSIRVEPKSYYSTGNAKFDKFFREVGWMDWYLRYAEYTVSHIKADVAELAGIKDYANIDLKKALEDFIKSAGVKFQVTIYTSGDYMYFRVKAIPVAGTELTDDLNRKIRAFEGIIKRVPELPVRLVNVAKQSVDLVVAGKDLIPAAKSGFPAYKAPSVIAKLTKSVDILTGVPGRIDKLTKDVQYTLNTIKEVFGVE